MEVHVGFHWRAQGVKCPSSSFTTASLSATDPAMFLHGAPRRTAAGQAAGNAGRGARVRNPGRSCADRGRGSEAGAHTHTGAHACRGPRRRPGRLGRGGGGGEAEAVRPVRSKVAAAARTWTAAAQCEPALLQWLLCLSKKERWRRPWAAFKGGRDPAREPGTGPG
jgi:hypothetical protein